MRSTDDFQRYEHDLVRDRRGISGAVDAWCSQSDRQRRWLLRRFRAGERVRQEFEDSLATVPGATAAWQSFCVTEQREILGTVNRLLPGPWARRRDIGRAIRTAVLAGPCSPPHSTASSTTKRDGDPPARA
jgi:hypothetical protein